jgi:hypothetical protein
MAGSIAHRAFGTSNEQALATSNGEGVADAAAAKPYALGRLRPEIGFAGVTPSRDATGYSIT